jgi:hypothetical protein
MARSETGGAIPIEPAMRATLTRSALGSTTEVFRKAVAMPFLSRGSGRED